MFDRAPIEMGRKRGYFKDEAARALLGLNKGDFMQNLGTYGAKEMGTNPVNFDLLRDRTYDQRFLPFVPRSTDNGCLPPQPLEASEKAFWK